VIGGPNNSAGIVNKCGDSGRVQNNRKQLREAALIDLRCNGVFTHFWLEELVETPRGGHRDWEEGEHDG